MRQQYHSRPTPKGQYIWDVFQLIELSKDLPVIDVPLTDIKELQENYWFDAPGQKPPTCYNIAERAFLIDIFNLLTVGSFISPIKSI